MATLTIRNIADSVKTLLRIRAARHGHSMEEEARRILAHALKSETTQPSEIPFGTLLHQHFMGLSDVPLPSRSAPRAPPGFTAAKVK